MKYARKQEIVEVFHNTPDKTVADFYDFIGHDSNLYRRTIMGDVLIKTKNGEKFLYPDSYVIKKTDGELEIINSEYEFNSLYEPVLKKNIQQLLFQYPYKEFETKFLNSDYLLNVCLRHDENGLFLQVLKEDLAGVVMLEHISPSKIFADLKKDWSQLQEVGYKYRMANAWADMGRDLVEFRIEKTKFLI